MKKNLKLSDKQFDALEEGTRRSLMEQLMMIDTGKYMYTLGCEGRFWTLNRYDREECIGMNKWEDDYKPEVVDKWD